MPHPSQEPPMKKTIVIATLAAVGVGASVDAHAGNTLVGGQLQILPSGELDTDLDGNLGPLSGSFNLGDHDLETAYGLALGAEYSVHQHITVGLMPRFLFNVKADDSDDGGTQLDIPLRVTGR